MFFKHFLKSILLPKQRPSPSLIRKRLHFSHREAIYCLIFILVKKELNYFFELLRYIRPIRVDQIWFWDGFDLLFGNLNILIIVEQEFAEVFPMICVWHRIRIFYYVDVFGSLANDLAHFLL